MIELLRFWNRHRHLSAEDASALAEGALAGRDAAAAHLAACDACRAQVDEIAELRRMLSALPEVDAPRSFRLRPVDVEQPATGRSAGSGIGLAPRLMPYVSAVAAAVFLVAVVVQVYPDGAADDDGDGDGLTMGMRAQPTGNLRAEDAAGAPAVEDDGAASGGTAADAPATAPEAGSTPATAEAIAPDASAAAGEDAQRDAPQPGAPSSDAFDSDGAAPESQPPSDAADAIERADDDDGASTWRLIAIISAAVAVVAGAGAVFARTRRGES
ncbi:MAG TPA: hypothetical protein VNM91_03065 [Dehalococcoidia bacterium]|nr:hypothetical protein [Dehalococcoidia bacterium]